MVNGKVIERGDFRTYLVPSSHCVSCMKSTVTEYQDVAHFLFGLH